MLDGVESIELLTRQYRECRFLQLSSLDLALARGTLSEGEYFQRRLERRPFLFVLSYTIA